ncbi:MAG: isoprenylcysteine carboxylmethyltransferase family protein [Actinomycetota bacterium]|nr:isoprenylcysteine carboxylmethyltransferase family protein [Actinomycetota bacterium]
MIGYWAFTVLIVLVAIERVVELRVSKCNLDWSFAHGGIEFGRTHYPFMVVLHAFLLAGSLIEVWVWQKPLVAALSWSMFVVVIAAQGLRWWCIRTLGQRWNTLVVVIPGLPRVTAGPYRLISHPNYVAVVIEGIALPLVGFAWVTALIFTLLNLPLLYVRLRVENQALASLPAAAM